ncbi:unnamed protein product, partial [Rotaria sp. Silwood2]
MHQYQYYTGPPVYTGDQYTGPPVNTGHQLAMLTTLILKSNLKISEAEFRFDQLQKHFENLNLQYAFGSEDATGVIKKIRYDSITNKFIGFPTPLEHGVPIKEYYHTDSLDTLKLWFNSIDKSSLLKVHMIQPVQSTTQNTIPSPFLVYSK